jgi:hypothetical protein
MKRSRGDDSSRPQSQSLVDLLLADDDAETIFQHVTSALSQADEETKERWKLERTDRACGDAWGKNNTALHLACQELGRDQIVLALIAAGFDARAMNDQRRTPLGDYLYYGGQHMAVVTQLLASDGRALVNMADEDGACAIHNFCLNYHFDTPSLEVWTLLLSMSTVDTLLSTFGSDKESVMHYAVRWCDVGHQGLVEHLIRVAPREAFFVKDAGGETPLMCARVETVPLLMSRFGVEQAQVMGWEKKKGGNKVSHVVVCESGRSQRFDSTISYRSAPRSLCARILQLEPGGVAAQRRQWMHSVDACRVFIVRVGSGNAVA